MKNTLKCFLGLFFGLFFVFSGSQALAYTTSSTSYFDILSFYYDTNNELKINAMIGPDFVGGYCMSFFGLNFSENPPGSFIDFHIDPEDLNMFCQPGTEYVPNNGIQSPNHGSCLFGVRGIGAVTLDHNATKSDIDTILGDNWLETHQDAKFTTVQASIACSITYNYDLITNYQAAFPFGTEYFLPDFYNPLITPYWPPDSLNTTTSDMTTWNASGTVDINALDLNIWTIMQIGLTPWGVSGPIFGSTYWASKEFSSPLAAGQSGSYSISAAEFPGLVDGVYQVEYRMIGNDPAGAAVYYNYLPPGTIIRDIEMPTSSTSTLPANFEGITLEDCSVLDIPNRWFCEIKNAVTSIFAPTKEKLNELKSTIDEIQNRFPINYINVGKNQWQSVYNSISATSTGISFGLLGSQKTNVSFEVFNSSGLKTVINSFFALIFISLWLFWAIKFLQRIF